MPENIAIGLLPPDHLESLVHRYRYAVARQLARGAVVDAACGWGYGAEMISHGAGVSHVVGVDRDDRAIYHARNCYGTESVEFCCQELESFEFTESHYTLVSIETLEHLKDPAEFIKRASAAGIGRAIVSIPILPTKDRNPFHLHDLTQAGLFEWFKGWDCIYEEIQRNTYLIAAFSR
jgi:cyclopropane fatty-acyl-phospholipid synthase-like methyltransferase